MLLNFYNLIVFLCTDFNKEIQIYVTLNFERLEKTKKLQMRKKTF